jgi:hypothetical protein
MKDTLTQKIARERAKFDRWFKRLKRACGELDRCRKRLRRWERQAQAEAAAEQDAATQKAGTLADALIARLAKPGEPTPQ